MPRIHIVRCALAVLVLVIGGGQRATAVDRSPGNHGTRQIAFVRFYEGYDGRGDSTCVIDINHEPYYLRQDFKHELADQVDCKNDHAASMVMENLNPGTVILLYVAPSCGTNEDWTKVVVLKRAASILVNEMNVPRVEANYSLESHDGTSDRKQSPDAPQGSRHSGIDISGNVSCLIIDMPSTAGKHAGPTTAT